MTVNHDVGLSCIQWRSSNCQSSCHLGVAWMQRFQGKGRDLCYKHAATRGHASINRSGAKSRHGSWC